MFQAKPITRALAFAFGGLACAGVTVPALAQAPAPQTLERVEITGSAIKRIAQRYKKQTGKDLFGQLFAEFCKTHGTPRYDELPSNKYEAAVRNSYSNSPS